MFERHIFARYSGAKFSNKYPDISGPAYHRTRRIKKDSKDKKGKKIVVYEVIDVKMGEAPVDSDIYGPSGIAQYKRLSKAYQLDQEAALYACSWGKFQIMGFNYSASGYKTISDFVKGMSSGDPAHIKAFLKFAKSNKNLLKGLQEKNFELIAKGHNGDNWKQINPEYANNLECFYGEYNAK